MLASHGNPDLPIPSSLLFFRPFPERLAFFAKYGNMHQMLVITFYRTKYAEL